MKTCLLAFLIAATVSLSAYAQNPPAAQPSADAKSKSDLDQEKKAGEWVASLKLNDAAKETRVKEVVAVHLKIIRDWHNEHPFSTVPAGVNPVNGKRLSDLDRQM